MELRTLKYSLWIPKFICKLRCIESKISYNFVLFCNRFVKIRVLFVEVKHLENI